MNAKSTKRGMGRVKQNQGDKMKNRLAETEKLLHSLDGKVLLVEGKHDVAALKALGVKAHFVSANGTPLSIAKRLEETGKKVFLMLDFDKEGLRKQSFFKAFLEEQGFSVDGVLARKLRGALGFTSVEEIERKYADLKEKGELHGKNVR